MKLIADEGEHLLPDSQRNQQHWAVRQLRRALGHALSPRGITIGMGLLLTGLLTAVLSLNYLDVSRNVDKNDIARKDFYADSRLEVVDPEATQRKIDRAKQAIRPMYQDPEPHNRDMTQSLNKLLVDLSPLAQDKAIPESERRERFLQLMGNSGEADAIFNRYFHATLAPADWNRVDQGSRAAMQAILKQGLTEADDQLNRESIIQGHIAKVGVSRAYRDLVYYIVDATLEPNFILDEPAMERVRHEVAAQISAEAPVTHTFVENQKIVGIGEKVTPVQAAALAKMGKTARGNNWVAVLGVFLLSLLFVFTLWTYLYNFREREFFRPSYAGLLASLTLLAVGLLQLPEQGLLTGMGTNGPFLLVAYVVTSSLTLSMLAAYALTLSIFMHHYIAVLSTTLLVFLMALATRADFSHLSVLLFGSYMGLYVLNKRTNYNDRGQLMTAGVWVGLTNALVLMACHLLSSGSDDPLVNLLGSLVAGFLGGIFSGVLTLGGLKPLEALFRLVTPYTLSELGNHNQPLLKRMQFEAPGTFHHSLMVATLAETAAEAIGANSLLTRVGCLYHDIGKMKRPLFFIENQAYFGVENPHDKLTPRLSKMVITAHPRDSIEMAKQHKLPECLMRFMTEHHGTLTAGYFYNKACIEEGVENVNKSQFRYPGPKPGSKETAIVMLADACESAVRALKAPTVGQVEERIDKIIQQRVEDGQFDNCPITFKDLNAIKQVFVRVLRGIQHSRIEYQQNMMRELGRKLPASTASDHAGLQEALTQIQTKLPSEEAAQDKAHDGGC